MHIIYLFTFPSHVHITVRYLCVKKSNYTNISTKLLIVSAYHNSAQVIFFPRTRNRAVNSQKPSYRSLFISACTIKPRNRFRAFGKQECMMVILYNPRSIILLVNLSLIPGSLSVQGSLFPFTSHVNRQNFPCQVYDLNDQAINSFGLNQSIEHKSMLASVSDLMTWCLRLNYGHCG